MTAGNIYMRIDGRETIQLNVSERSEPDENGPQPAMFWFASRDGSKVFFTTSELLTNDAQQGTNVYEYDLNAPAGKHLRLISVDEEPATEQAEKGNRGTAVVGASADGSYVYFLGENRLLPGQGSFPETEYEDRSELYVWHEGTIRALAFHIVYSDLKDGWGEEGFVGGNLFRVTPDGKHIVFNSMVPSTAHGLGYVNIGTHLTDIQACRPRGECQETYTYDYDTNRMVCASCDSSGAAPRDDTSFAKVVGEFRLSSPAQLLNKPLSSDGRYVFFNTIDPLVVQDTNHRIDVYEYDTLDGQVHLISSGSCGCDAFFMDASADGSDVFFATSQQLVRIDGDDSVDLYDARVQGGIPAQNHAPPAPCESDDCQGPAKSPPTFSLPSSLTFAGAGNPTPPAGSAVAPKSKPATRAQRLRSALRACQALRSGKRRSRCQARARKRFRANGSARRVSRRAGR